VTPRDALIAEARRYLGKREQMVNGKPSNRSTLIDAWNTEVAAPLGSPYCCSGVSQWGVQGVGRSAWPFKLTASVATLVAECQRNGLFSRDVRQARVGDLVVFYFDSLARWAHIGVVVTLTPKFVTSVDANTTPSVPAGTAADRDGSGVFEKTRPIGPHVGFCLWPAT